MARMRPNYSHFALLYAAVFLQKSCTAFCRPTNLEPFWPNCGKKTNYARETIITIQSQIPLVSTCSTARCICPTMYKREQQVVRKIHNKSKVYYSTI